MSTSYSHMAPVGISPQRIQEYGVGLFDPIPTKSAWKKALKKGHVLVNDHVATTATMIRGGEKIVYTPGEIPQPDRKFNLKLRVLFEDDFLAMVDKPAGVLVSGNSFRTIANALPENLKKSTQADVVLPQPVHRLDFPTTGILLAGKTAEAIRNLSGLFENKEVGKYYYAVTIGSMRSEGIIDKPIQGKEAITHYEKVATLDSPRFTHLNLVKLQPKTGRRHQLRIHMASMGNAILGDPDYTPEHYILKGKGLYLHAFSLTFTHPFTGSEIRQTAPIPKRFTKLFPDFAFK